MNNIKLGSLCITKITKSFVIKGENIKIPKGTYVTVCDDDDINEGYVLVESEDFDIFAVSYKIDELILIK